MPENKDKQRIQITLKSREKKNVKINRVSVLRNVKCKRKKKWTLFLNFNSTTAPNPDNNYNNNTYLFGTRRRRRFGVNLNAL